MAGVRSSPLVDVFAQANALWYDAPAVHLFLILSAPLAYIYLLILRDQAAQTPGVTAISALRGAIAYLVILLPLLIVRRFVRQPFSGEGLYFYPLVHDFAIPLYLGLVLYLWFTRDVGGLSPEERFLSFASFLAGAFTLAGTMDVFIRADYFGPYELFYLPALRIALMLIAPSLYYHLSSGTFWVRYVYLILLLGLPFALSPVALLTSMSFGPAAAALTAALFVGGWAFVLFGIGSARSIRFR